LPDKMGVSDSVTLYNVNLILDEPPLIVSKYVLSLGIIDPLD
jgi:hypothetical protein